MLLAHQSIEVHADDLLPGLLGEVEHLRVELHHVGLLRRFLAFCRSSLKVANISGVDHEVPCELVPPERALEVSIAENSSREPLHPADEFDAFKAMIDEARASRTLRRVSACRF